mmetsp:Transcript_52809/g.82349  ORF Transcript_52809/g.82349 Transcript_52809/m.82349 type:complete len:90 (+) Transcript_52809:1322-1591(+)
MGQEAKTPASSSLKRTEMQSKHSFESSNDGASNCSAIKQAIGIQFALCWCITSPVTIKRALVSYRAYEKLNQRKRIFAPGLFLDAMSAC